MTRKKLPIGIQSFEEIRTDGYYYVDKTPYALRLVDEGKYYFLSRPRRFGKSLFLSTLAEMFGGNRELFEGLYCYDRWDWDVVYPVVRLSFSARTLSAEWLDQRIGELLADNERRLGLPTGSGTAAGRLTTLIRHAEEKHGQKVVVLVDEYDKPMLDTLSDPDLARAVRDRLASLYGPLKEESVHLKFVLLTGVSKFSKVNIFSGLNNLNDITLDEGYSAICGYTEGDVDTVFASELDGLDRDEVRQWYNGYNWTGEAVYNPFDLLLLFQKRKFRPYWFETGTPTFLVETLMRQSYYLPRLQQVDATESLLSAFDVGSVSPEALLFQTGYLTIGATREVTQGLRYLLRFPNREVRASLTEALLSACSPDPGQVVARTGRLPDLLEAADFAGIEELFTSHFASIPHDWYRKNEIAQAEGYYASVFYAFFASLGLDTIPEDTSSFGRLDMAVRLPEAVWLFELKMVDDEPEGSALRQIKDRGYADKYRADGLPVHLVGVEFSRARRNVVAFDAETISA